MTGIFITEHLLICGVPACAHRLVVGARTRPTAEKRARAEGWKWTPARGWVCPRCVREKRYLERAR